MKKTLISALTTALVVGAASTTFAAANPFSDVPADHWAYDAVTQLAADGIIEGYGDTTFQGDKNITRYEMAQMIAKAMAKQDVPATDKALIDKLAAEFADELNNLGVRVSNLEKHADMVKWNGELRYRYDSTHVEGQDKANRDRLLFRLKPTAEVNQNWDVHAQLDAQTNLKQDGTDHVTLARAWAQGNYKNFSTKLGKQDLWSDVDQGMTFDDAFSGAQVTFGSKLKATLEAGRWSGLEGNGDVAGNYQGIELADKFGKLYAGVEYRHFNSDALKVRDGYNKAGESDDSADIWGVGGGYTFDKNWNIFGAYAQNSKAEAFDKSGNVQVNYKGADKANKGTWGAYAAYRHIGSNVSFAPTYDTATSGFLSAANGGSKGWEVGAEYTPFHNTLTALYYFDGKQLATDADNKVLFGRVSFFF